MPQAEFSAVILAGGASRRMGRDKAWLTVEGMPLVRRQAELARRAGAAEVWISGREGVDYSAAGAPVLLDRTPGLGPLEGVALALAAARSDCVLVMAVDQPRVTQGFLEWLASARAASGGGAAAAVGGKPEPFPGLYPRSMLPLAEELLRGGRRAMREWIARGVAAGMLVVIEAPAEHREVFANWNSPEDLRGTEAEGAV